MGGKTHEVRVGQKNALLPNKRGDEILMRLIRRVQRGNPAHIVTLGGRLPANADGQFLIII